MERDLRKNRTVLGYENLWCGPWLEFTDSKGTGHCQPDFVLKYSTYVLILECKLTEKPTAWIQLRRLYEPLLSELYPMLPVRCIQVCKNLSDNAAVGSRRQISNGLRNPVDGTTLHFLGHEGLI